VDVWLYLIGVDIGINLPRCCALLRRPGKLRTPLTSGCNYIHRMFGGNAMWSQAAARQDDRGETARSEFSGSGSAANQARDVFGLLGIAVNEVISVRPDAITAIKNGKSPTRWCFSGKTAGISPTSQANDNRTFGDPHYANAREYLFRGAAEQPCTKLIDKGQTRIYSPSVDDVLITNTGNGARSYRRVAKL